MTVSVTPSGFIKVKLSNSFRACSTDKMAPEKVAYFRFADDFSHPDKHPVVSDQIVYNLFSYAL